MSGRARGSANLQGLDDLIRGKKKNSLSLSPNDALVQIALPLVLILAIITRLMVIEYTGGDAKQGPAGVGNVETADHSEDGYSIE